MAFGRTYLWEDPENGLRHYLKVQAPDESEAQFRLQSERMNYLFTHSQDLELKSTCGKPVNLVTIDRAHLARLPQTTEEDAHHPFQQSLRDRVARGKRLALYFTLPIDQPYEAYLNNGQLTPDEQLDALKRSAEDFGKLWRQGINPPDILSAFHDRESDRRYFPLLTLNETLVKLIALYSLQVTDLK